MDAIITQPHSYAALATERTIRVIVLHPENNFDAPLQCLLEHLEIEDSAEPGREYEAISYCWGEAIFTHALLCNGRALKINPNVDSLLRHLRRSDIPQRFWIDGVCINQQDLNEKSSQISLMRDIYFCATRVRVWLGDATTTDFEAFTLIRRLAFLNKAARKPTAREIDKLLDRTAAQSLDSIDAMLARPWFTRRWILQEIGLSHETLLHCGHLSINKSFLLPALELLQARIDDHSTTVPHGLNSLLTQAISVCGCSPLGKPVAELLVSYRTSMCLDARDAIFALLALGGDDLTKPRSIHKGLDIRSFEPSYKESTVEIYTHFAMHCILSGYYAQMLCMAVCFPCEGSLSWVPDMRLFGTSHGFRGTELMLYSNILVNSWSKIRKSLHYNAFSKLESQTIPTADGTGFWLAPDVPHAVRRIQWTGSLLPEGESRDSIVGTLRHWLSPFVQERVCEHSAQSRPFYATAEPKSSKNLICECEEAEKCRALVCAAVASAQAKLADFGVLQDELLHFVLVRGLVPTASQNDSSSPWTFEWRSLAEATPNYTEINTEIYINAYVFGLDRSGIVPLDILSLFLGTIMASSHTDVAPALSSTGAEEWFKIEVSKRLGFLQLLTSGLVQTRTGISQAWSALFVKDHRSFSHSRKNGAGIRLIEVDCTDEICATLQCLGSKRRLCVVSERDVDRHKSLRVAPRRFRDGFRQGTMLVMCPCETRVGDTLLVLKISHKDRERPARHFGSYSSSSTSSRSSSSNTQSRPSVDYDFESGSFADRNEDFRALPSPPNGRLEHETFPTATPEETSHQEPRFEWIPLARANGDFKTLPPSQPPPPSPPPEWSEHDPFPAETYKNTNDKLPEWLKQALLSKEISNKDNDECVPRQYEYLSLVLTPSGRLERPPESLHDFFSDFSMQEGVGGHRILGDALVPYLYDGLYSSPAHILING